MEGLWLKKAQIKIAIVASDRVYSHWLGQQLAGLPSLVKIYYLTPEQVLIDTISSLKLDIVFIEMQVSSISGIGVIRMLREVPNSGSIIAISSQTNELAALEAFQAGAIGFLAKQKARSEDFSQAVVEVLNGGAPVSNGLMRRVVEKLYQKRKTPRQEQASAISRRERQILQLLNTGYSSKEISDELFISYHTVRTHLKNIYKKLGVGSINQAVAKTKRF